MKTKPRFDFTLILLFCIYTGLAFSQSIITIGNTPVVIDTLVTGLDVPWEVVYGADQHLWVTERKGRVSRINPATGSSTVILDITAKVAQHAESGMLGIILHPYYPVVNEIFLVYNYGSLPLLRERLVKFNFQNGMLQNEQTVIDSILGNTGHNGSRLVFLTDLTLLMTTGEAHDGNRSQNLSSLNGKTLRTNTDGTIPADNPISGSYVYSFGHRNSQGLMLAPNGTIYASEHGAVTDDEFQVIEKAGNYGWPLVEGFCDTPAEMSNCIMKKIKEPLRAWTPTYAVGDLEWYANNSFPELDNSILMATLKAKKLVVLKLDEAGTVVVSENSYLTNLFGRLRAVCAGSSGEIYIATNGADAANIDPNTHSIIVIRPPAPVVGLNESTMRSTVKIFPTISSERLVIIGAEAGGLLDLFNGQGQLCRSVALEGGRQEINIEDLAPSSYILRLRTGGKSVYHSRFIKR